MSKAFIGVLALVAGVWARGCPTPLKITWLDDPVAPVVELPALADGSDASKSYVRASCTEGKLVPPLPASAAFTATEVSVLEAFKCEVRMLYAYNLGRGVFDVTYPGFYNAEMIIGLQHQCNKYINGSETPPGPAGQALVDLVRELTHGSCAIATIDGLFADVGFKRFQFSTTDRGFGYNWAVNGDKSLTNVGPDLAPLKKLWNEAVNVAATSTAYTVVGRSLAAAKMHGCDGTWFTPNAGDTMYGGITLLEIDVYFPVDGHAGDAAVAALRRDVAVYEVCRQVLAFVYGREEIPGVMVVLCVEQTAADTKKTKATPGAFTTAVVPLIEMTVDTTSLVYTAAMTVAAAVNSGTFTVTALGGRAVGHAFSASVRNGDTVDVLKVLHFDNNDDENPIPDLFTVEDLLPSMEAVIASYTPPAPPPVPPAPPAPPAPIPPPPPQGSRDTTEIGVGAAVGGLLVGAMLTLVYHARTIHRARGYALDTSGRANLLPNGESYEGTP